MSSEVRTVASLALLYAFRMLGLFMVLPILMLYGQSYSGATPFLLGLALGIYGLTQALFQIPLGLMSDIFGRKLIIVVGLLVFAAGSFIAAYATSAEGLVLGRALQGSGAIASAIMAMVADLTSEQNRTKAMAAIGASIGLSFSIAMVLGPTLAAFSGLKGVFVLSGVLAFAGIVIVVFIVPNPKRLHISHRDTGAIPRLILSTIKNAELFRLNYGIFCLHCVLMSSFVVVPSLFESSLGLERSRHWVVYLPMLLASFILMLPLMLFAEKKQKVKPVFVGAIFGLAFVFFAIGYTHTSGPLLVLFILTFFIVFNLLEATLPSLVSKIAPVGSKGTAMGLYSTSQFLGAFVGGVGGGTLVSADEGASWVFYTSALLVLSWGLVAVSMKRPMHLSSLCFSVQPGFKKSKEVGVIAGVEEVLLVEEELLLYLKVDKKKLDQVALEALLGAEVEAM